MSERYDVPEDIIYEIAKRSDYNTRKNIARVNRDYNVVSRTPTYQRMIQESLDKINVIIGKLKAKVIIALHEGGVLDTITPTLGVHNFNALRNFFIGHNFRTTEYNSYNVNEFGKPSIIVSDINSYLDYMFRHITRAKISGSKERSMYDFWRYIPGKLTDINNGHGYLLEFNPKMLVEAYILKENV